MCFFVGLLYELEMGIFTGVGTHLVIVLYNSARPRVRVDIKQVRISSYSEDFTREMRNYLCLLRTIEDHDNKFMTRCNLHIV